MVLSRRRNVSYVYGNPPFIGFWWHLRGAHQQDPSFRTYELPLGCFWKPPRLRMRLVPKGRSGIRSNGKRKIAFVATSSITQGEQVAELWPLLFRRYNLEITFAHRTFAWGSEARGKAHVHVVIIGLALRDQAPKDRGIFDYADYDSDPTESIVRVISPYLFNAANLAYPHTVVVRTAPIDGMPFMFIGSKPIDGGNYILSEEERDALVRADPRAVAYLHPDVGSEEFINGGKRWILALQNAAPSDIRTMPDVRKRVEAVRGFRRASKSAPTKKLADTPMLYHVNVIPKRPFLVVPEVSSEQREYVPIGYLQPPVIPSNLVRVIESALFLSLASSRHACTCHGCVVLAAGLESRYRYSIGLVYNPFPWPILTSAAEIQIGKLAQAVLDARTNHSTSTLADLYDTAAMPADLRKAHQSLDAAVDKLYRKELFSSDRERVEFLLARYERERAPMVVAAQPVGKRRRNQ